MGFCKAFQYRSLYRCSIQGISLPGIKGMDFTIVLFHYSVIKAEIKLDSGKTYNKESGLNCIPLSCVWKDI